MAKSQKPIEDPAPPVESPTILVHKPTAQEVRDANKPAPETVLEHPVSFRVALLDERGQEVAGPAPEVMQARSESEAIELYKAKHFPVGKRDAVAKRVE